MELRGPSPPRSSTPPGHGLVFATGDLGAGAGEVGQDPVGAAPWAPTCEGHRLLEAPGASFWGPAFCSPDLAGLLWSSDRQPPGAARPCLSLTLEAKGPPQPRVFMVVGTLRRICEEGSLDLNLPLVFVAWPEHYLVPMSLRKRGPQRPPI